MSGDLLNGDLVLRRSYSSTDQAIKTVPAGNTSFQIELSAADGDNVTTIPQALLISDATETACIGIKSVELYVEPGAAASVKMQISPVDSGDVWMDVTTSTVNSDPTNLVSGGNKTICARRIRASVVSGTPVYHIVGHSV